MSRYGGGGAGSGGDYHRDRRERSPPRFPDRRPSYNEPPRAPRGRELRDAPPLSRPFRDSRDFSPRDADPPRPRRNSRDGPLSAGSTYSDSAPSFRGGFGRGRGRGDSEFRGGRGGRRFDDRDIYPRDRSPPSRWTREDRSPPRRDDRRFDRREDGRWNDSWSDRESDRWRDAPLNNAENRPIGDSQAGGGNGTASAGPLNPDRMALIDEKGSDMSLRRASTINVPPHSSRLDSRRDLQDVPPYLSGRADSTGSKYASRAPSSPTQPPPVPAFTLSFTPSAQQAAPPTTAIKTEVKTDPQAGTTADVSHDNASQRSPVLPRAPKAEVPPSAPRAPKALEVEQAGSSTQRLHGVRSWDALPSAANASQPRTASTTQPTSPVLQTNNRPLDVIPPTGPKATRATSQSAHSPRPPFAEPDYAPIAASRSRSPPVDAPSGPRGHTFSRSPEMSFTNAPTGPKLDRMPPIAPRGSDRANMLIRASDKTALQGPARAPPTAPRSQQQAWNLWRRGTAPGALDKRESTIEDRRSEQRASEHNQPLASTDTTRHRDSTLTALEIKLPSSPAKGHSAQQSFFGQPAAPQHDELASDVADDSISSSDDDEIEVEDLALFEAKFKRRQRELEAKLVDLSAREYRATTPLETIARLARVTMRDVERFRERENEMDLDDAQARHGPPGASATQSSASDEAVDLPTPKGEENTAVQIHTEEEADEDVRRIYRPAPEIISLPYMTRDPKISLDYSLNSESNETVAKSIEHEYQAAFSKHDSTAWNLEQEFMARYQAWRELCEDLDHLREQQEEMERQLSLEPGPEPDAPPNATSNPVYEGRRLHKFASEYEMEQVLKQSEETARLEQEKADREAKRVQADMEKEAELPDQLTKTEYLSQAFIDDNRLRDPESLTVVFTYEPAPDNFTEEEQQIFVAAFKETPKKWTEIASLLPGREPKDCIRHYYTNKWDGRFRDNKHRRNKAGRRGRGGKTVRSRGSAAMADLAGGDDMPVAVSDSGRPKRAAAPTTFAEKESDAKALLSNQSPAKRANVKQEGAAESDKPAKRRKGAGEKPGRKPKGAQPLAQIAAAPTMSPEGRPLQIVQSKESLDRSRALEDASLLTSFHAGRPALPVDQQAMFSAEKIMPRTVDDPERMRVPLPAPSTKPGPSSYWSVPEQGDFIKYIAYFGTDFAAIAAHMGTKTQTMIKNHYQRQISGLPGLEESAMAANGRRQRGENLGAPPTPTPITKRKYDSAATMSRTIVPQGGDPMDVDEPRSTSRPSLNKHGSPHQFSLRPQYPPTTAPTPQLSHTGPSLSAQDASAASARQYQSSLGSRGSIFSDTRPDGRASVSGAPTFFPPASGTASQPPQSSSRTTQDSHDPYIRGLIEEQQRAIRLQDQQYQEHEQVEPFYHRALQQQPTHRSPTMSHTHSQQHERRSLGEYRTNTPPTSYYSARSTPGDPSRKISDRASHLLDPIRFPPPNPQAIPSPPKRDNMRAMPATSNFSSATPKPPTPAASEAPKRMDLFSMLNNTEEPKPKRSSIDPIASSAAPRAGSPPRPSAQAASPYSTSRARTEHYSQPPVNQYSATSSSSSRPSLSHLSGSARSPPPRTPLKQEALPSGMPSQDWPPRSNVHSMASQPALPLEREVRPYYSHRSSIYPQEAGRANPSPPPVSSLHHSRAPSIADSQPHARGYGSQPAAPSSSTIGAGSSLYSNPPPYSHAGSYPGSTAHSHHSHTAQASHGYAPPHHRGPSREDSFLREQATRESDREREDREREWRYQRDRDEAEHQRRQEHERHYPRGSAPSLQPPSYGMSYDTSPSRMTSVGMSLREQSAREAEIAMQQQAERMSSIYGREREQVMQPQAAEDARRRHDDAQSAARRTPLGPGGYGPPPLPGPGRR